MSFRLILVSALESLKGAQGILFVSVDIFADFSPFMFRDAFFGFSRDGDRAHVFSPSSERSREMKTLIFSGFISHTKFMQLHHPRMAVKKSRQENAGASGLKILRMAAATKKDFLKVFCFYF